MATELYSDGSITLSAGSETVTGAGTAWAIYGVNGGLLTADGLPGPIPIAAVPGDAEMTLAWPSPVSLTTASYAIVPWTAEQMRALWANRQLSQMIARAVGVNLARSAFGSVLSDRDTYDAEPAGFAFVLVEEHEDPVLYLKLSDEDGDWSPAKPWRGPTGRDGIDASLATLLAAARPEDGDDASTLAINLDLGDKLFHQFSIEGNRTLGYPTDIPNPGVSFYVKIVQDAVGGRTLSFAAGYVGHRGVLPTISEVAEAETLLCVVVLDEDRAAIFSVGQEFGA